ncbi:MAG: AAA family ATPase [Candidatus Magnetomorum sp.]|nr:AAA family ATPase [Candidatus Magnetomorum sp.]
MRQSYTNIQAEKKMLAFCGKGGVGKTSLCALTAKICCENSSKKILAIDADPAIGLSTSLGIQVTKTVDDIRNELVKRIQSKAGNQRQWLSEINYELFDALKEIDNLAFLAIGRPEGDGCYCQVNRFLKEMIHDLADHFDTVLIDGEAGIEQVNRRVMDKVTHLFLISDTSRKGLTVAETIHRVAAQKIPFQHAGLILNRVQSDNDFQTARQHTQLPVLGCIFEDENIYHMDRSDQTVMNLKKTSAMADLETLLSDLKIL